jgi:hypothetical protein
VLDRCAVSIVRPGGAHTSSGGEIIVLDSAGYGAATITPSLSIIAPPGVYAGVSVFSGDGITINGSGIEVTLRGLTINGLGGVNGIHVLDATRVRIEDCVVSAMSSMGIYMQAQASMTVVNTRVRGNGVHGIYVIPQNPGVYTAVLDHVRSEENGTDGVFLDNGVELVVNDSMFAQNGMFGVHLFPDAGEGIAVSLTRSTVARNGTSGIGMSGPGDSSVMLSDNAIVFNTAPGGALSVPPGPNYRMYTMQNNAFTFNSALVTGGGTLQTLPLQ